MTGFQDRTIPIAGDRAIAGTWVFTPDGKALIGWVRAYTRKRDDDYQDHLKFWDVQTGKELASFAAEEKEETGTTPSGRAG